MSPDKVTDEREIEEFVVAHHAELIAFRRHLHAHPELSNDEHDTRDSIAERLRVAGLDPQPLSKGTGLVCDLGATGAGGDSPLIALRADIDALAMDDELDVPYRSQRPGVAHACGHDVHTTVVLGAGLALAERFADRGRFRLVFEHAEESLPGGAVDVIDEGWLDGVDAIFGLHCDPKLDAGEVAVRAGALTSATDMVLIDLHGPGGHTARPQLTVDLVSVAGRVVTELPATIAAQTEGAALLVFGALRTGDAANVIPSHAELRGTFRTPRYDIWVEAEARVEAALADLLAGTGAEWTLRYQQGIPPVVNTEPETAVLSEAITAAVGPEGLAHAQQSLGGDSFAWYLQHVPGSYGRLGVHDPDNPRQLDLHSSTFDVDERAIDIGVRVLVCAALQASARRPRG